MIAGNSIAVIAAAFHTPGVLLAGVTNGLFVQAFSSVPILSEGGFDVLFDVMGLCYKNGRVMKVWGKENGTTGAGDTSVSRCI